jgi:hypothetical protein
MPVSVHWLFFFHIRQFKFLINVNLLSRAQTILLSNIKLKTTVYMVVLALYMVMELLWLSLTLAMWRPFVVIVVTAPQMYIVDVC